MFTLEKRKLRGDLVTVVHSLKENCGEDADGISSVVCSERTRGNDESSNKGNWFSIRKKILTMRDCAALQWVLREAEGPLSLETFKTRLHKALTTLSLVLL